MRSRISRWFRPGANDHDASEDVATNLRYARTYRDVDLTGEDFSGRVLIGTRFERCAVRGCDFAGSDLSYSSFVGCDLYATVFDEAVLYACSFSECDLTKANFGGSYFSGVRFRDVDTTHTEFGNEFLLGRNRKSLGVTPIPSDELLDWGAEIGSIATYEKDGRGIRVRGFDRWIEFTDDPRNETWRQWRRRSEMCKVVKRVQLENGYFDKAIEYYYRERRYLRFAMPRGPRRLADWFFGETLWGYGVQWHKAAISFAVSVVAFSAAYLMMPDVLGGENGLAVGSDGLASVDWGAGLESNLEDVALTAFFSLTYAITAPVDISPVGWGRAIAALQVVWFIVLLGLLVASVSKRSANI